MNIGNSKSEIIVQQPTFRKKTSSERLQEFYLNAVNGKEIHIRKQLYEALAENNNFEQEKFENFTTSSMPSVDFETLEN